MVASNNIKQQVEQIINQTRNGYYPGGGDFACNGNTAGTAPSITSAAPGAVPQGTNNTCVFFGKAVEFGVAKSAADPNKDQVFATYPIIGNRQVNVAGVTQEVNTYAQAGAIALAPPSSASSIPDHSEFSRTQNGLSFKKATYHLSGGAVPTTLGYAVFAVTDDLSGYQINASTNDLNSGLEKLNLYYFGATPNWASAPVDTYGVVSGINTRHVYDVPVPPSPLALDSIDLCFDGIVANQTATVTITGKGQLSVKLKISNAPSC
jgi:hypothetical protein